MDMEETLRRTSLQTKEFDAGFAFAKSIKALGCTPVVDDDYPEVRFDYERALTELIVAMKENGRFVTASRYGLIPYEDTL